MAMNSATKVMAFHLLLLVGAASVPNQGRSRELVSYMKERFASVLRMGADQRAFVQSLPSVSGAPPMPTKWVAFINQTVIVNGTAVPTQLPFPTGDMLPKFAVDSGKKRLIYQFHFKFAYAPAEYVGTSSEWFNTTVFLTDTFEGMDLNTNKYMNAENPIGGMYQDMFAWVPHARDMGIATFKGKQVHRWTLETGSTKCELLTDARGLPVHMTLQSANSVQNMEFVDFVADVEIPNVWDGFSEDSFKKPLLCPQSAPAALVKMAAYIFHPKNEFNISGQDLGDSTGDVFFTCTDVMGGQSPVVDHNYAWVTQWEVELLPRWGQYQNCNGYNPATCVGLNDFWVGREAANYIGSTNATDRQCGSTNPLVGAWWSLPEGGRCGPGQQPGDGSCTWRARRVKTIDGKCLLQGDRYKDACTKDGRGPFSLASVLFLEAFASEDASQRGCPNIAPIRPAACSWNSGCVGKQLAGDCCPASDGTMLSCCGVAAGNSIGNNSTLMTRFIV